METIAMETRTKIILLISTLTFISLIAAIIYIYPILVFSAVFSDLEHSSKKELIENYEAKYKEINEVKRYINSVVSSNKAIEIEFDRANSISIFRVTVNGNCDGDYDLDIDSKKADSLLWKAGWTRETLLTLKEKLKVADCISAESGDPCLIGYHRSGMGKYSYLISIKI